MRPFVNLGPNVPPAVLRRLMANLTVFVPTPRKAQPKAQLSWQGLRPGQRLQVTRPAQDAEGRRAPVGFTFTIDVCDSGGLDLEPTFRWETPDWAATFRKLPKVRKAAVRRRRAK